ncbi:MAG: hypothetical protein R2731_11725 [Nocardioides sp.]
MPVVHIRALRTLETDVDIVLTTTADAVARALDADPHGTWCTFAPLFGESLGTELVDYGGIAYVDVWLRARDEAQERAVLVAACRAVAGALGIPVEDVWGTLRRVEPGQVFAGGGLVED